MGNIVLRGWLPCTTTWLSADELISPLVCLSCYQQWWNSVSSIETTWLAGVFEMRNCACSCLNMEIILVWFCYSNCVSKCGVSTMAVAVTRADNIVSISYFDFLKIHCLSFLWGLWILLKEFLRKVLRKSKGSEQTDQRRKPPECLSGDFGQHLYVKLQVIKSKMNIKLIILWILLWNRWLWLRLNIPFSC